MNKMRNAFLIVCTAIIFAGCAGQTTDPRQGGLFSYNPNAYQQRLQSRQDALSVIATDNEAAEQESAFLEDQAEVQAQEKAALEQLLQEINASTASLENSIRSKEAETAAIKQEQQRIITEIGRIKAAARITDNIQDPEEKRLKLERLRQRRDELEKEAAQLMLL